MFSAGWVLRSSVRVTKPNCAMAGWVEHSSAISIALPFRAVAIGTSQAASAWRWAGGYVIPYLTSAPLHTLFVSHSGGRPHLSWVWTAARSLIFDRFRVVAVSLRTTKALPSWAGAILRTVIPPPLVDRIVWSAARLACPSPLSLVGS